MRMAICARVSVCVLSGKEKKRPSERCGCPVQPPKNHPFGERFWANWYGQPAAIHQLPSILGVRFLDLERRYGAGNKGCSEREKKGIASSTRPATRGQASPGPMFPSFQLIDHGRRAVRAGSRPGHFVPPPFFPTLFFPGVACPLVAGLEHSDALVLFLLCTLRPSPTCFRGHQRSAGRQPHLLNPFPPIPTPSTVRLHFRRNGKILFCALFLLFFCSGAFQTPYGEGVCVRGGWHPVRFFLFFGLFFIFSPSINPSRSLTLYSIQIFGPRETFLPPEEAGTVKMMNGRVKKGITGRSARRPQTRLTRHPRGGWPLPSFRFLRLAPLALTFQRLVLWANGTWATTRNVTNNSPNLRRVKGRVDGWCTGDGYDFTLIFFLWSEGIKWHAGRARTPWHARGCGRQ